MLADGPATISGPLNSQPSACKGRKLDIAPWQLPPCATNLDSALREQFGEPHGRREAAEVLKKLLALGLSKFEPDPLRAIAEAEAKGVGGCPL